MDCKESRCFLQCKSCLRVASKSDSCEMLSTVVCEHCGTLQGKEETEFETPYPIFFSSRQFGPAESPTFRKFVDKAIGISNTLNLPPRLTDEVLYLAQRIYNDNVLKRQKCGPKVAACIFYVTRSNSHAIPIQKLSSATETQVNCIHKCLALCVKRLKLQPLSYLGCAAYLEQYVTYFENRSPRVMIEWSKTTESIARIPLKATSPSIAAAALLNIVLEAREKSHDFKDFCKKFFVNFQHAKNVSSLIRKSLFSVAQKIPWKPSTLNERNVASFLPEILDYYKEFKPENDMPVLHNSVSCLPEKVQLVLEDRAKNKDSIALRQRDQQCDIIWQLLNRGCPKEEILSEKLSTLSQRYLDFTNDTEVVESEIPDEEIEELLK